MLYKQNSSLQEPITHITQSRPFSFHHTVVPPESELVLYLHWHNEIEFLYIERGETIFCIEERKYHLKTGDAIFVPPNMLHMAEGINGSECDFYAVVCSTYFLSDSHINPHYAKYSNPIMHHNLGCPLHLTPSVAWHKDILKYIKDMLQISLGNLEQWELQLHGTLLIIWQMLYNNHLSKIENSVNVTGLVAQLDNSIRYMHSFYNDEITLQQLADLSHLSEGQFCRLFKQLTSFTPFSYLNRYRILKSCEYLSSTTKKVGEIASLCGFNNISFFNREFIKYIKVTPSAYRKAVNDNI